jgi:hypothetical protein
LSKAAIDVRPMGIELLPKGPFFKGIPAPEKTFLELHLGQVPVFNGSPPC